MKQVDVLCIGHACWDLNFQVAVLPGVDEKTRAQSLISEGGGPASNAAFAIRSLGGTAAFVGRLGNDAFGDAHAQQLREAGVDIGALLRTRAPTPIASVWVDKFGHRSVVNYSEPHEFLEFDFEDIKPACLLFDGHEMEASIAVLEKFPGIPSILDAGSFRKSTKALAKNVSHLICSSAYALEATQNKDPKVWIRELGSIDQCVAITCGVEGVHWRDALGKSNHIPARHVCAVDTTGAGDIFHGAFALAMSREKTFSHALKWANVVAADSVTRRGGRSSYLTHNNVSSLENFRG